MRIVVQQIRVLVAVTAFTSGSWFNINSVKVAHEMTMTCNKLYVVEIRLEEFWDLRCGKVAFEIVVYNDDGVVIRIQKHTKRISTIERFVVVQR